MLADVAFSGGTYMPDFEGTEGGQRGVQRGVEPRHHRPGMSTRGFGAQEQDEPRCGHILVDAMLGTRRVSGDHVMNSPRCTQTLSVLGS